MLIAAIPRGAAVSWACVRKSSIKQAAFRRWTATSSTRRRDSPRLVGKLDEGYDVVLVHDGDQEAELVRERHAIRATALAVGVAGVLLFVWSIRIAGTAAV